MDSQPSTETLWALDGQYVWHPFTPHSVYPQESPLMIVAGDGHELIDSDGRRYLDGVSSLWCSVFGHRRPEIDAAIQAQLGRIAHATFLGNATAPAVTLAKRLTELDQRTQPSLHSTIPTAVEIELKMALTPATNPGGSKHTFRPLERPIMEIRLGPFLWAESISFTLATADYSSIRFRHHHPAHIDTRVMRRAPRLKKQPCSRSKP